MKEVLKIENLDKVYSNNGVSVQALQNVNLSIEEGEYLVIAGPSGSGKTTLLNLLGSLDKPTNGKIMLAGEELAKKNKNELSEIRLRKMGFIFQAYNLIPVLTALENVEFPMMLAGISPKDRRAKALNVMAELGIAQLADKRPNQMSGGQQQRVAAARAIANNPIIVLADEPTANLDSKSGDTLLDLMENMNKKMNITFIFSSHDKQVIDRAKRLLTLKDGNIISDERKN